MRSTLTTTEPTEARRWLKALDMAIVLHEYDQWLRSQLKHGGAGRETELAREQLHETMGTYGVDLEDLLQ